jgi:hypothetical protein
METIALATFLFVMLYLMSRVLAVYMRVRDEGVQHSEELLRNGVTFGALRDGNVPDHGTGTLVSAREGLLMEASRDGLMVKGTRTIARDTF